MIFATSMQCRVQTRPPGFMNLFQSDGFPKHEHQICVKIVLKIVILCGPKDIIHTMCEVLSKLGRGAYQKLAHNLCLKMITSYNLNCNI